MRPEDQLALERAERNRLQDEVVEIARLVKSDGSHRATVDAIHRLLAIEGVVKDLIGGSLSEGNSCRGAHAQEARECAGGEMNRDTVVREGILTLRANTKRVDTPAVREWMRECSRRIKEAYTDMLIFGSGKLLLPSFSTEHDVKPAPSRRPRKATPSKMRGNR